MLDHRQIAALIVLPLAATGVICNWTVAIIIRRLPSMQNAFGRLTSSQSIGDATHSSLFLFYYVPMCLFNSSFLMKYSEHCGHLLLIAYDISTYSHLFISLNRFCAIYRPVQYEQIFSKRNTNLTIVFSWVVAIFPTFYYYVYKDCRFIYLDNFWAFVFTTTPICQKITWYADFLKYNSIVCMIVVIDVITVSKVRNFKQKVTGVVCKSHAKKKRNEINFLKQACLQAAVFLVELVTYFIITPIVTDEYKWGRFFLSTFAWVFVRSYEIITISFNKEVLEYIFGKILQDKMPSRLSFITRARTSSDVIQHPKNPSSIH
ncbi:unnamed protein product [Caenorhabditis bovis]|uniref:G-protein coupled receptors family 1 profile domain-containing protein n=1 Tax=Caenorhabditis bovis TaxID=2654633 RepID=A0A8S1E6W1_9PELO|nr:unnamed protein product [Caenorhabditis bovis]